MVETRHQINLLHVNVKQLDDGNKRKVRLAACRELCQLLLVYLDAVDRGVNDSRRVDPRREEIVELRRAHVVAEIDFDARDLRVRDWPIDCARHNRRIPILNRSLGHVSILQSFASKLGSQKMQKLH